MLILLLFLIVYCITFTVLCVFVSDTDVMSCFAVDDDSCF